MKKKIAILILALLMCCGSIAPNVFAIADDETSAEDAPTSREVKPSFDASKITATDPALKTALVNTIAEYLEDRDLSTDHGRKLAQLVSSLELGHTLSASLVVNPSPEITNEAVVQAITEATSSENLAFVADVSFVVTDTSDSSRSVSLYEVASPVDVTVAVPDQYKEALRTRGVTITRVSVNSDDTNIETIENVRFNTSGNVVFKTSDFSYFALSYDGEVISAASSDDTPVPNTSAYGAETSAPAPAPAPTTVAEPADYGTVTTPDTSGFFGIDLTVFHLLTLIAIALVAIALLAYATKRAYLRNKISFK